MVKWALGLIGVITLLVIVVLALPVQQWRAGEMPQPELHYAPTPINAVKAARVGIDSDPACGTGKHRDPDDCLALLSLASAPGIDIVGISTVFGNAPVSKTDAVIRALAAELGPRANHRLPVFKGCGGAAQKCLEDGGSLDAQTALRRALRAGALDYVALGPLTNLAAVLAKEPVLASRISRVIASIPARTAASAPCLSAMGRPFVISMPCSTPGPCPPSWPRTSR